MSLYESAINGEEHGDKMVELESKSAVEDAVVAAASDEVFATNIAKVPAIINPYEFTVVLASQSKLKLECVMRYYKQTHPNVVVRSIEARTDYVQPLGIEQAERCVDQRLQCAEEAMDKQTALLVALENFVYFDARDNKYRDACLLGVRRVGAVLVHDTQFSNDVQSYSVEVPSILTKRLDEEFAREPEPHMDETCGSLLRVRFGSHPDYWDNDWFVATGAPFNRSQQIDALLSINTSLMNVLPE
jgi:non-canonical (house-cleaning) NTP pyrophosphatase